MAGSGTKNAAWVSWLQKEGFRQARWELHLYLQLWHVNAEPKRSTRVNAISYDRLDITQSLGNSIQAPDFMSCKRHAMKVWHGRLTSNLNFQADCNPPSLPTHFQPICYLSLLPLHFFLFFDWRNCHRGLLLPRTWWAALRRTRPPRVGGKTGGKTSAKLEGFVVHKTCLCTTSRNLLLVYANYQKVWSSMTRIDCSKSSSLRIQYDIPWLP